MRGRTARNKAIKREELEERNAQHKEMAVYQEAFMRGYESGAKSLVPSTRIAMIDFKEWYNNKFKK